MAVIVLQPRAKADLSEIWEFIADDSNDQADAFIDLIDQKFQLLAHQVGLGRRRVELAEGLRSFAVGRYVISISPFPLGFRSCGCSTEPVTSRLHSQSRKPMNDRKHLSGREFERLLEAVKGSRNEIRDRCLVLLMLRHGLRVSEACFLVLEQVDIKSRVLHVARLKGGSLPRTRSGATRSAPSRLGWWSAPE